MSELDANASGDHVDSSGIDAGKNPKTDSSIKYETYQKVLAEKKREQQEKQILAEKLKSYEQKELEAQGKHQELLESLRNEVKAKDEKLSQVIQSVALKSIESQIVVEAQKYGCLDTDALIKLIDRKKLEVDQETFTVNQDDLTREMEKIVKERDWLFKKAGPKINDLVPSANAPRQQKTIGDMSKSELLELWKNAKV